MTPPPRTKVELALLIIVVLFAISEGVRYLYQQDQLAQHQPVFVIHPSRR